MAQLFESSFKKFYQQIYEKNSSFVISILTKLQKKKKIEIFKLYQYYSK